MQQVFYTTVSNANTHTGKACKTYKSDPIPLLKENFLGEFRSELEKAKVRKNLNIPDDVTLRWENIQGDIDSAPSLLEYIEKVWGYTTPLYEDVTNVKEALDKMLEFINQFSSEEEDIKLLQKDLTDLTNEFNTVSIQVASLATWITETNKTIANINSLLDNINEIIKISEQANNALVDNDGLYVKDLSQDIVDLVAAAKTEINLDITTINDTLSEHAESIEDLKNAGGYFDSELEDDVEIPESVGGIRKGTTVAELKGESITDILNQMLFPTVVRDLVEPTLTFNISDLLVKVGSAVLNAKLIFTQGDAGDVTSEEIVVSPTVSDTYSSLTTYNYTGTVKYDAGDYLVDNKDNVTKIRVEEGSLTAKVAIETTYPWYINNEEQELVPFILESEFEFSLSGTPSIKLPGTRSSIKSFEVNGGLGYMGVNFDAWTKTEELINGITYQVWTKNESYAVMTKHKLKFTLVL